MCTVELRLFVIRKNFWLRCVEVIDASLLNKLHTVVVESRRVEEGPSNVALVNRLVVFAHFRLRTRRASFD